MACDMCTDPDGEPCFPLYGIGPHIHQPGGGMILLPGAAMAGYTANPAEPGHGWHWCPHCGSGKPEGVEPTTPILKGEKEMTPQQSAAVLSAALANDKKNGVLRISGMALSKHERAELHQVVGAYGAASTVKLAREHCSPGPKMTAVFTVLLMVLFCGLAVLWLPFLLCALLAPVLVPWRVAKGKARWLQILPPERDADRLELV